MVLLNDVQFVEASRHLAETLLEAFPEAKASERLAHAFELMTSRPPTEQELTILEDALAEQHKNYRRQGNEAQALLANGDSSRNEDLNTAEHAAYTAVANLIINLSESITKN